MNKNLYFCGNCGEEAREGRPEYPKKVVLAGYANLLCRRCKMILDAEITYIARRYLANKLLEAKHEDKKN